MIFNYIYIFILLFSFSTSFLHIGINAGFRRHPRFFRRHPRYWYCRYHRPFRPIIIINGTLKPIGPCLNKLCPENYTCFKDQCYADEIFERILLRKTPYIY